MGKRKYNILSQEERNKLKVDIRKGILTKRQLAYKYKISISQVSNFRKFFKQNLSKIQKPVRGRPKKIQPQHLCSMIKSIKIQPKQNYYQLGQMLFEKYNLVVCEKTIKLALKAKGYSYYICQRKPILTSTNLRKRLSLSQIYLAQKQEFWAQIIYSDESYFRQYQRQYKRYLSNRRIINEKTTIGTKKFGGIQVRVFGVLGYNLKLPLIIFKGNLNSQEYIKILEKSVVIFIKDQRKVNPEKSFLFMQDGAACHRAKSTMQYLQELDIQVMEWPAQSCDLNPIENIWSHLMNQIEEVEKQNVFTFENALIREWEKLDQKYINRLILNCYKRWMQVKKSKGGMTRY